MTRPAGSAELDLRAVLDAAVDAIVIIDALGTIESFNPAAEKLFGYAAAEVIGQNVRMLMPDPYRREHDSYLSNYLTTGKRKIIGIGREAIACRRDGSQFPIALAVGQIQGQPQPRFVGFIHDISDRVRALDELRRERDRAQSYLDLAEVMLLALDQRGRVKLINRKGEELMGWREQELVGRDWFATCLPAGEQDRLREGFFSRISTKAQPWTAENEVLTRDGRTRLIAWRNVTINDAEGNVTGTLSSGEDVTEQREAVAALRDSERLLRQAQAMAGLANYEALIPPEGSKRRRESYWSEQMFRMTARDQSQPLPRAIEFIERYVDPADRDHVRRRWQQVAASGGLFDIEYRLRAEDGQVRVVHSVATVVRQEDGTLHVSGTLHDITERRRTEDEMREAQERLTQFARLSTMGEMAAGLAHEINQPLTAITLYSQALRRMAAKPGGLEGGEAQEAQEALEQIAAQALRAGEVIRRLRSFVKSRQVQQVQASATRLVGESVAFAEHEARLRDVRLEVDVAAGLPPVHCDPVQIQQVLLNLLRNAIEATVEASPALREVQVRAAPGGPGEVEFSVSDHGSGISPLVAENLGNPFFTTKPTGTGLGVAISRSILRAHGGNFGHRSTPGGGATVFFTLPAEPGGGS